MAKRVNIVGIIGFDTYSKGIIDELAKINGEDLDIYIASPGGLVFDGLEIYNAFRDYKRKYPNSQIMATAKGLVASMASYLMSNPAFDLVAAEDNAVYMIHNPIGGIIGDYRDMGKYADVLKGLRNTLAKSYVSQTGKSEKEIKQMMDDETWLFGDEIKNEGFADEMVQPEDSCGGKKKKAAILESKTIFAAMKDKMSKSEIDVNKIAAMFSDNSTSETPADAGQNNMEVISMNLKEFLEQNPAAKSEYHSQIEDARKAGYEKGVADIRATVKTASMYLTADRKYPDQIKALAVSVVNGEKPVDALTTTVTVYDAMTEKGKSDDAKGESAATGGHGEQSAPAGQENGSIKNKAD